MSRSFRKTPNYYPKLSEKDDKKEWHSRLRARFRDALSRARDLEELIVPHFREVSDKWEMMKDCDGLSNLKMGKWWIERKKKTDPKLFTK